MPTVVSGDGDAIAGITGERATPVGAALGSIGDIADRPLPNARMRLGIQDRRVFEKSIRSLVHRQLLFLSNIKCVKS